MMCTFVQIEKKTMSSKVFNTIYSIDNLIIDYSLSKRDAQSLMNYFSILSYCKSYTSTSMNKFHYCYSLSLENESGFFVGIEPNWVMEKSSRVTCRIDFNPNKVGHVVEFIDIINILNRTMARKSVRRYDLAIDINVSREDCFLFKDKRTYSEYRNSNKDRTQYLGHRSKQGRVKLYNKQLESNLNVPLTRLELTLDYDGYCDHINAFGCFPRVLITDSLQFNLNIKGTDKILLLACLEHEEYLSELSRRKKEKVTELMNEVTATLEFEFDKFHKAFGTINRYLNVIN